MAAEDNGLSSPFAKVVFSTQCLVTRVGNSPCRWKDHSSLILATVSCLTTPKTSKMLNEIHVSAQVLPETLSPAWCETLLFDRVLLEGTPEQLRQDPPLIIINIYSHSSMVAPAFLFPAKIELARHSGFGLTSPVSLCCRAAQSHSAGPSHSQSLKLWTSCIRSRTFVSMT